MRSSSLWCGVFTAAPKTIALWMFVYSVPKVGVLHTPPGCASLSAPRLLLELPCLHSLRVVKAEIDGHSRADPIHLAPVVALVHCDSEECEQLRSMHLAVAGFISNDRRSSSGWTTCLWNCGTNTRKELHFELFWCTSPRRIAS